MDKTENQNQAASVTSRLLSPDEIAIVTGGTGSGKDAGVDASTAGSEEPEPGT